MKKEKRFERAALVLLVLLFFLPKGFAKEKTEKEVSKPNEPDDGENPINIPPDDGFRSEVNIPPERETEIVIREPDPEPEATTKECEVIIDEEAFERSFDHNLRSGGGGGGDWLITERDGNRRRMEHQFRVAR